MIACFVDIMVVLFRYGELDEVKVALLQGYDPNLIGLYQWSALHEAANNGEVEILKSLLKNKG
jgi:ankyrin repeat protein